MAQAIACRSFTLSNGGRDVLSATYHSPFGIGTPTTLTFCSLIIWSKSFGGKPVEISASPRSSMARRVPAEGTSRAMMRLSFGSGPLFQWSKRARMVSLPGFQLSTL